MGLEYQPQAVKRQQIPKSGGGMRELGIPTVLDRFIQQALLQVLQPRFDPTFSEHSHGFRPGKRAHDAIVEAQRHIQEGRRWVVDVDLEMIVAWRLARARNSTDVDWRLARARNSTDVDWRLARARNSTDVGCDSRREELD